MKIENYNLNDPLPDLDDPRRFKPGELLAMDDPRLNATRKDEEIIARQIAQFRPSKPGPRHALPVDSAPRKQLPIATGVVDYFPAAMVAIAELSRKGNDQHNPGQPLHWSRGKSDDHPDALMRHFIERGKMDVDGIRHSAKVAWRALAILQLELEVAAKTAEERTWRLGDAVRARAWPDIPEEAVGLPCDVERHE